MYTGGCMPQLEGIFRFIEDSAERMIDLQRMLCAVPAIAPESGGQGEWEKAVTLKAFLREQGFDQIRQLDVPDARVPRGKRPNLILDYPGEAGAASLWIMTHMDVVPPGEEKRWQGNPYELRVDADRLIGRGVEDNQQGLVSSVFALLALKRLGVRPAAGIKLLFVADEETGSDYGIKYLLKQHADLFKKGDCVLVPDAGSSDGTMIEIAEKSILWLKFRITGKQCHASLPHLGINAFVAGSDLVLRLYGLNREYTEQDPLFTPPVSTFSPTKKEANVPNINTIPGEDIFYLDCRILPSLKNQEVLDRIREIMTEIRNRYDVVIDMEIIQNEWSPPTSGDAPLVASLRQAIRTVYGVEGKTVGIGGGTVGAHLRKKGIDTVVWARIESTAHMPNEYCLIENMVGDAKVMAHIMLRAGR
jgi:succinyl-diaminopimelate desuccinylase